MGPLRAMRLHHLVLHVFFSVVPSALRDNFRGNDDIYTPLIFSGEIGGLGKNTLLCAYKYFGNLKAG